jgi:protein gp37
MTEIEWTEETWNPVTGCTRVSAGCLHCYIERTPPMRMSHRRFDGPGIGATLPVQLHPERLDQPLHWRKPRRVFVNSMSDLFHDAVHEEFIARVWATMAATPQHTYQILTKRPARMRGLLRGLYGGDWPLPNVWLGVSAENQETADLRIPKLLETPAAVRFVSAEPLLGSIDLSAWLAGHCTCSGAGARVPLPPVDGVHWSGCPALRRAGLDWLIVGGESGPGARPMHPWWARTLRDQCYAGGVPYFFKQWGEWAPVGPLYGALDESDYDVVEQAHMDAVAYEVDERREVVQLEPHGTIADEYQAADGSWLMARLGKKRAGRELDGRTWDEYPLPPVVVP